MGSTLFGSGLVKLLIKPLSAILAAVMAFAGNIFYKPGVTDIPAARVDFTPAVRFTVTSDVHLKDSGVTAEAERLGMMIDSSYDIAGESASYKALDAVAFSGDLTDRGSPYTLQMFRDICDSHLNGDTQNLAVMGNHEFGYDKENTIANWQSIVEIPYRYHKVINGFHFIGVAPDRGGGGYTVDTQVWLGKQLKEAAADKPDYPIFVFQHHHIFGTVYGSMSWGTADLTAVLSQYPQVIDFSGHSHYPLNDPASIWQGAFTALGTATLSYYEMEYFPLTGGQFPEGNRNAAQMYVVEADANGAVKIRGFDLLAGEFIGETYYIATPADKTTFAYSTKNRLAKSEKPAFGEDACLTAAKNADGSYSLGFPAATDDLIVRQYEILVKEQWGGIAYHETHLSDYYYTPAPASYSLNIGQLKSGKTYSATVIAADAWYKLSEPLTLIFKAE